LLEQSDNDLMNIGLLKRGYQDFTFGAFFGQKDFTFGAKDFTFGAFF